MRRRWLTAILVLTLLASSWAAFGPWVMAGAACYLAIMIAMRRRRATWIAADKAILSGVFVVPVAAALAWLYLTDLREEALQRQCGNHLKEVAMALLNYHQYEKCFPPSCLYDSNGRPMHSWRVLTLLWDCGYGRVYQEYDFNEPWNGPHNRLLESTGAELYICPTAERAGEINPR